LSNPGIVSIPIGFIAAWLGTILTARDADAEAKFAELKVRAHTGLGSEKATAH
jgi:cation/acetate symporter